jgi:hypothetical protein
VQLYETTWNAWAEFTTREEAEALMATLPKLLKAEITTCVRWDRDGRPKTYDVCIRTRMREAKGNKANETGYKRFKKLVEIAELQVVHGTLDIEEALAWYGAQCE